MSANGKSWNAKKWADMTPAGRIGCISLVVFSVVVGCLRSNNTSHTTTMSTPVGVAGSSYSTTTSRPTYSSSPYGPYSSSGSYTTTTTPSFTPLAEPPPDGEVVTVTRVIDGDTLEVAGNRRIRIPGIEACEASDPGGPAATAAAEAALEGDTSYSYMRRPVITLVREPGVDRDRYDRELRYVHVDGRDLGNDLVYAWEIGVYEGHNDADPEYMAELRESDSYSGLTCDGSDPVPPASGGGDVNVNTGDGDDDGESRFVGAVGTASPTRAPPGRGPRVQHGVIGRRASSF